MTLDKAEMQKVYRIDSLLESHHFNVDQLKRLKYLGFHFDQEIKLVKKAPLFQDPLLFQINGSLIALTKKEAQQIRIKEL